MIEKLWAMLKPPMIYPDVTIQCPICQQFTNIGNVSRHVRYRLDCLICCQIPLVGVVATEYVREEIDRTLFTDFYPTLTKMHFKLPNDENNMYVWEWNYKNKTTTLSRVEKDCAQPIVHVFEEIININLDNFIQKTKTCLIFS